jgi:glycosyltransferase involved in cell wall biosynthesis
MRILSPMPTGSGSYVLHQQLAEHLDGYRLRPYSPWWTLCPPALPLFSRGRADLIHSAADYGCFFRRSGVPLVATIHNYVCDSFMRPYSSRLQYLHYRTDLRLFTRRTLAVADRVVAISRFVEERVAEDLGVSVPMRLIYNGVDERRFVPASPAGRRGQGPIKVLFCGNLNRRKRADLLVPLANALGGGFEIHYTAGLAGAADLTDRPGPAAATLKNRGAVAHANMPAVYQGVDVLFMPSVREGFGLCVAEAMACGLPVVAADAGATPELVHHGVGGYLCAIDDLDAYADAIRRIAASPEDARQMGDYNRALVEQRFTLARMVDEYRQLFEETLDRGVNR